MTELDEERIAEWAEEYRMDEYFENTYGPDWWGKLYGDDEEEEEEDDE